MSNRELDKLDTLDLSRMTMADVQKLDDDALKKTLLEAVQRSVEASSFQQHISHSDHSQGPRQQDPP